MLKENIIRPRRHPLIANFLFTKQNSHFNSRLISMHSHIPESLQDKIKTSDNNISRHLLDRWCKQTNSLISVDDNLTSLRAL